MTDTTAAAAYERDLVPNIFAPWARLLLDGAGLQPGQQVLDVACGTGIAARLAAVAVGAQGAVVGTDIDEGMLAVARRCLVEADAAPIDWRHADAMALPLADASFDAVLCCEGIQFFPDRAKGLAEFRRVLRPGGRLLGTLWGPLAENPGYQALAEGLAQFVSADAGRLPPFSLHDPAVLRALLADAGFEQIVITPHRMVRPVPSTRAFVDWVAAGAPTTRHKLSLLAAADRDAFLRFVEQRLAPYRGSDGLAMPYMRHLFTASRAAA